MAISATATSLSDQMGCVACWTGKALISAIRSSISVGSVSAPWRYGHDHQPVGGFGDSEELIAGYEAAGGGGGQPRSLHYWEVFGTLRWGILCIIMGFAHLNGPNPSLEKAAIGRRTAETEFDLLQLID